MFSATAAAGINDCPEIVFIAAFGANIFGSCLHTAIGVVFSAATATGICDCPSVIGISAFLAIEVHILSPCHYPGFFVPPKSVVQCHLSFFNIIKNLHGRTRKVKFFRFTCGKFKPLRFRTPEERLRTLPPNYIEKCNYTGKKDIEKCKKCLISARKAIYAQQEDSGRVDESTALFKHATELLHDTLCRLIMYIRNRSTKRLNIIKKASMPLFSKWF